MAKHVFTGFGFGPIQSGLFLKEAFESGNFDRFVVAEVDQKLVDALRANNGTYYINIAKADGVEVVQIDNVELFNPNVAQDKKALLEALARSTEITTSLPSVKFYDMGGDTCVASLIAHGVNNSKTDATIIYAAENNNHAAEILEKAVEPKLNIGPGKEVRFLNTVIGKMSQVVTDPDQVESLNLKPIAPGIDRAFLVEEFNKILVTRAAIDRFTPGIEVFMEKDDLLPFEEAKLYGHNAIHALLAYLGHVKGYGKMSELKADDTLMKIAAKAFIDESGTALIGKYGKLGDELFTVTGFQGYADDLLERMTNTYLTDAIARTGRDPVRKLGTTDRIFGTMSLTLKYGVTPTNMALGAIAGIAFLLAQPEENDLPEELRFSDWKKMTDSDIEKIIKWIWQGQSTKFNDELIELVKNAKPSLANIIE
ncbi:hypothetical protein ACFL3G_04405 [Planctomycetota bacterium]